MSPSRAGWADVLATSRAEDTHRCGAGALVGRRDWLDAAPPHLAGGGAVREVGIGVTDWAPAPQRHEAGTPNVLGAAALAQACRTVAPVLDGPVPEHEQELLDRLGAGLDRVPGVRRTEGARWTYAPVAGRWTPTTDPREIDPLGIGATGQLGPACTRRPSRSGRGTQVR